MDTSKIEGIVGKSVEMQGCLSKLSEAAENSTPILINGEIGTGKRLFAQRIHEISTLQDRPFRIFEEISIVKHPFIFSMGGSLKINLSKVKGGTLVFHDIDTLRTVSQNDLTSFLSEQELKSLVGEPESLFRLIATTAKSLQDMVLKGTFSERLYQFISEFQIQIQLTPLRERKKDIEDIAGYHLRKICSDRCLDQKECTADFISALENYGWPHNIKELIEVLEVSVRNSENKSKLEANHLPLNIYRPEKKHILMPENLIRELEDSNAKQPTTTNLPQCIDNNEKLHVALQKTGKENVTGFKPPMDITRPILCFYEDDDCWRIGRIGCEKRIKKLIGLKIIHFLLSRPNKYLGCGEIWEDLKGSAGNEGAEKLYEGPNMKTSKSIDDSINLKILDGASKRKIENTINLLKENIKGMENVGCNYEEILQKKHDLKLIEKYVKESNQSDHTSQDGKARSNTQKHIKKNNDKIIKKMPYMKVHLEKIETGYKCIYRLDIEETAPEWILYKAAYNRRNQKS